MTFLKDTQPIAIAPLRRRPTESSRFWLILAGGSIAMHGGLLLGLGWMNFRASIATSAADPTPIELIELAPNPPADGDAIAPAEGIAALPPEANQAAPVAPPETAPPASIPEASNPEVAIAPPEFVEPPPTPTPTPEPSALPVSPPPVPPDPEPPASTPPPIAPPVPAQPPIDPPLDPAPAQPEQTEPAESTPDQSAELPPASTDESDSSGQSEPDEIGEPGLGEPGLGESEGGIIDEGLPPVPAMPSYEALAGFKASLSVSSPPAEVPQPIAEPIEPDQTFLNDGSQTACTAPPSIISAWGRPVQFRVRIDRTDDPTVGYVAAEDSMIPQLGSGNEAYDLLAACLLREWAFRPPDTDAAIENEAPSSEVIVTVQLSPE